MMRRSALAFSTANGVRPHSAIVNGQKQILFGGGDGFCYAFDPKPVKEGEDNLLKTALEVRLQSARISKKFKYPAAEGPSEINATPGVL